MEEAIQEEREVPSQPALLVEEEARARFYALIAHLFLSSPGPALLEALAAAPPLPTAQVGNRLEQAWERLTVAAGLLPASMVEEEFNALFIGVGAPRINPNGSLYLAGFLMEKPLADLRSDLARLGLGRRGQAAETEDHLAALCESMRLLITGELGVARQEIAQQQAFFQRHLAPWYSRCMEDMRQVQEANFYRCVADFTEVFLEMEEEAFSMEQASCVE